MDSLHLNDSFLVLQLFSFVSLVHLFSLLFRKKEMKQCITYRSRKESKQKSRSTPLKVKGKTPAKKLHCDNFPRSQF